MYCIMYKYIKYLYNIHFVIGYDKKPIYVCIQYYMVIVLYEIYKAKKAKERHI